jgi:hypothetical protein
VSDLAQALMVAIRVHAGQTDKQGEPYLLHVLRVVEAVSDEAKVVAALHDVLEDGEGVLDIASHDSIRALDELDDDEEEALSVLTRGVEEYASYIGGIIETEGRAGRIAREVKLADLRDNLGRIPEITVETPGDEERYDGWQSLRRRYERAIATLEASS